MLGNEYMSAKTTMAALVGSICEEVEVPSARSKLQMNAWLGGQYSGVKGPFSEPLCSCSFPSELDLIRSGRTNQARHDFPRS